MPKILSRNELYRLLQRELPEGVYPDGAPSAFFSTADMDSVAQTLATAYGSASATYDEMFPASAYNFLSDWEVELFGAVGPASMTQQDRRDRILQKLRIRTGIKKSEIESVVEITIGSSPDFEVVEWQSASGGWIIGVSELALTTFLGMHSLVKYTGADINCEIATGTVPVQADEVLRMRMQSFTYEVRFYNRTLTAKELSELNAALDAAEPARCGHVITDGLTDADRIGV